ncbi:MAG: hypothetical protein ACR2HN_09370 [Tepidiformaceae bacterium]
MLAGCGGDDDDAGTGTTNAAPAGSEQPATALKAAHLIPDLAPLGFALLSQQPDPAAVRLGQDVHQAAYEKKSAPPMILRLDVFVYPDEAIARKDFATKSAALKNPPPGAFGPNTQFRDATATAAGDESKAYQATGIDPQGNRVWLEAIRSGRVVFTIQLVAADKDSGAVRKGIADATLARLEQ